MEWITSADGDGNEVDIGGCGGCKCDRELSVCERSVCVWIGGLPMSCDHASV